MAYWNQNFGALVSALGTYGSGGRYELYSHYLLEIQAVAASFFSAGKRIPC